MKTQTSRRPPLSEKFMKLNALVLPLKVAVVICLVVIGIDFAGSLLKELLIGSGVFKGTHYDFLAFYSAASFTLHGHIQQIFNTEVLTSFQRQIINHPVGAAGYMPFLNPPYVAVLLLPLAILPIAKARLVWLAINAVLMILIAYCLARPLLDLRKIARSQGESARAGNGLTEGEVPVGTSIEDRPLPAEIIGPGDGGALHKSSLTKRWRLLGTALLLSTFPVYQSLIDGQLSVLMLFGCVMAYIFAQRQRYVLSGVWLSLLWLKPQFAVFAIIGLIIARQWRVIAGMLGTLFLVAVVMLPITGIASYFTYSHFMYGVLGDHFNGAGAIIPTAWRGSLNTAAGLNGFYAALVGQTKVTLVNLLTGLTTVGLIALFILAARKVKPSLNSAKERLMLAAAIAAALLINPHLYAQDVLLLYIILPLLAGFKHYLRTIVLVVLACDLINIDQANPIHLFTTLLTLFAIIVFVKMIADPKLIPAHPK